jgi:hypothetical protein
MSVKITYRSVTICNTEYINVVMGGPYDVGGTLCRVVDSTPDSVIIEGNIKICRSLIQ